MRIPKTTAWAGLIAITFLPLLPAAPMPKEDVIEVPAISEGLSLHNLFQSNMVIQRDKPVTLWGWASPGEKIITSLADKSQVTTASKDRSWKVTFPALPANSDPIQITIQGSKKNLTLDNILVGDVWVLGGQSNMEFPLDRIENGQLEIVSANYQNIRILTVPAKAGAKKEKGIARLHEWSGWFNQHYRKGDWDVCSSEIARELSAIGYVFARRVHMASQVPIGIIDASRGGTTVETWTPDPVLRKIKSERVTNLLTEWDKKVADWDAKNNLLGRIKKHHEWVARMKKDGKKIPADRTTPDDLRPGPAFDANRPGNCYAGMMGPLEGLAIKGAIFHQGYNNCFKGTEGTLMYREIFPEMIKAWRAAFNDPEMPFGILSLCTDGTKQTLDNYTELMANAGPFLREVQYRTYLDLVKAGDQNIGFTSTYDLRRRWYHPQLKIPAGERIARWALATEYGLEKALRWKPPVVTETKVENGSITLTFNEAVSGVDDGGIVEGFAIAGKDRKFHPANAAHLVTGKDDRNRDKKDQKSLVLSSAMVSKPIHFRYAWGRNPMGNLQAHHNTDIPVATQRSDTWPLEEIYLDDPEKLERLEGRQLKAALRTEDQKRHRKEAESILENKEG
tara:strand:- start:1681 stop:3543 length:1863 start_codon:yes stop_codon:yes gene_type:complete